MNITPPQTKLPSVISKQKDAYKLWLLVYKNFPKFERFGLGQKIDHHFIELLEITFRSVYLGKDRKIIALESAVARLDTVRFLLQLSWESKIIALKQYSDLSLLCDEIGKMIGGWKKGLESKNSSA